MTHADGDDTLWNAERVDLHRLIAERSTTLAGMYRLAVVLMDSPAPEGEERARLSAVGHCLRELMNNLPDALRDVEGMPAGGGNSNLETKTVVEAYEQFRGGVSAPPQEDQHSQEPDLVTVPRSFVESVGRLHSSYRQGERRAAQRDSAAVLGRMDPSDPAVRTWRAAKDFFMDLTHLDQTTVRALRLRIHPPIRKCSPSWRLWKLH